MKSSNFHSISLLLPFLGLIGLTLPLAHADCLLVYKNDQQYSKLMQNSSCAGNTCSATLVKAVECPNSTDEWKSAKCDGEKIKESDLPVLVQDGKCHSLKELLHSGNTKESIDWKRLKSPGSSRSSGDAT